MENNKLKILHVANRAEKKDGQRFYSLPYKINNGLVREGHNVYWFSDRDIARASAIIPSPKLGRGACNRRLLKVCANFRPDMVLLAHADLIDNETLMEIKRKYNVLLVQYNIDPLHKHNVTQLTWRNGIVDHNFITTGGSILQSLSANGTKYAFMPNPVDKSIDCYENFASTSLPIDVFFAGQPSERISSEDLRNQIVKLPAELPSIKFGYYNGVWGNEYLNLLGKSKIGLSFSVHLKSTLQGDGGSEYLYSSDRISQYLGNGLLTFVEKRFRLSDLYGHDCLVEVDGYEELKDKILYFCNNNDELQMKAARSHKIVHDHFNEQLVVRYMLEASRGLIFSSDYHWPTTSWQV